MTIAELLTIARGIYLSEGVGDYLWIDSFVLTAFSEAQRQACNRTDFIYEDVTIPLVSGTASYTLNNRITKLEKVLFDGLEVVKRSSAELDYINKPWRTDTAMSGKNCSYIVRGNKIRFVPGPAASDDALVVTLECYVMPSASFTALSNSPVIPVECHRDLIYWVIHEALSQVDIKKSNFYLDKFDAKFGKPVSAQVRQHQLENGLSTVVSPFNYSGSASRNTTIDTETW